MKKNHPAVGKACCGYGLEIGPSPASRVLPTDLSIFHRWLTTEALGLMLHYNHLIWGKGEEKGEGETSDCHDMYILFSQFNI